jgi:hypothetical protein
MAVRDLVDNAPGHDLVGDLAARPLADRPTRPLRRFAGQRHNLADLLVADPPRLARPQRIRQTIQYREVFQRRWLQDPPAFSPQPNHVDADPVLAGNLRIDTARPPPPRQSGLAPLSAGAYCIGALAPRAPGARLLSIQPSGAWGHASLVPPCVSAANQLPCPHYTTGLLRRMCTSLIVAVIWMPMLCAGGWQLGRLRVRRHLGGEGSEEP